MSALRFFPTSLRARLLLAFLLLVALILFVGGATFTINQEVRRRVSDLRSGTGIDLREVDLAHVGLEFEGTWNPAGSFVATDVELLPGAARPRLRGTIEAVDRTERTFRIYGRTIHFTPDTESGEEDDEPADFDGLAPGKRVEVACKVEGERWEAGKVYLRDVKASDKVKGTVTRADLDGKAPETVEIHGLLVVVEPDASSGPESALGLVEKATQAILALRECQNAANELSGSPSALDAESAERGEPAVERLRRAVERFGEQVELALGAEESPTRAAPPEVLGILRQLQRRLPALRERVEQLAAGTPGGGAALQKAGSELDDYLQRELVPHAYAFLSKAEDELGDQLRGVLERTARTTRIALLTSVVAVLLAFGLGFLVWRSIHRPVQVLKDAAESFGRGYLGTRVQLDSFAELNVLAESFNRMASELSSTTVSMESLECVFDSMAAALIVFDPDGNIVNVNRATLALTGYERGDLVGRTFDVMCRFSSGESVRPGPGSRDPSGLPAMRIETVERVFVRKDGSEFPVSFSGAELRSHGGPLQGYVCVALDLTEHKRVQERLRESLDEKELLLREVHHRVKNNMQVISSLLAMQSTGGDPEVARRLEESQNRIRSIALIHEQLYRSTELAHIDVRTYLDVLTNQLLQSFGKAGTVAIELEADAVKMDIDESMACGLIVNELVTNAMKYAYPGAAGGRIRVSLREHAGGERVLTVADDGPGLDPRKNGPPTLGLSLVRTLARQLRGRVEVDGTRGTVVRVFFGRRAQEAVA